MSGAGVCQNQDRTPWGALRPDSEVLVNHFSHDEWRLQDELDKRRAEGLVCEWSDIPSDECPHCTGDLTGFEIECEHGNNAFGCHKCAVNP